MRTNNYFFKLLIAIILLVSINFNHVFAQVTITAPSATVTACTTFPTSSSPLGNIVITEIANGDISGSGTLILTAPTNFEFTAAGTTSATGTEITGLSSVLTNSTTITLAFTVGGTAEINAITISGIQIRGITAATPASDVTRTGGTSVINGDANGAVHATLTSTLTPTLSSTLTPAAICSGTSFNYTPTSSVAGTSFAWTRAAVSGISNLAGSGTGNPNEILINTSATPVNVTYVYTLSANGCTNTTLFSVIVTVEPTPTLVSSLSPPAICSGTTFTYTPASGTSGATFAWARAAVSGITNPSSSGTGNPIETLVNTITTPVNVTYAYTLSANGCTNPTTYSVIVTVEPTPTLSSTLSPPAICSGTAFSYVPASGTSGATFSWTRAVFVGISNPAGSGSGNANEVLINTTVNPINVSYDYTVSANGCTNPTTYNVVVTVNPASIAPIANAATNITCTSLNANWSVSTGATAYYLDVSTSASFTTFVSGYNNLNVSNVTTYNVTGLTVNETYYYRVRASNGCGTSLNSTSIQVSTNAPNASVATVASNINCASFDANWGASIGATAYYLDVSTSASFSTFVSGYNNLNTGNVTTYSLTGLTATTTYYYRIRASNGCSTSTNSNTIMVNTNPTPVAWAASNVTCTSFDANWGLVSGATTYFLDIATDALFSTFLSGYNNLNTGNVGTYNITGLSANTSYYYRIRVNTSCGTSINSNTITVNTAAPSVPVAIAASNTTCISFDANWNLSTGATNYFIDVATDVAFTALVSGYNNLNVNNVTTYTITGLNPNTVYYYRVRASNSCTTSSNSNTITVNTNPTPLALAASNITCTSINANWVAVSGATSYFLDVATDSTFTSFISGYNNLNVNNTTTYNVTGLTVNTTYYYRLRANNTCGTSVNSNTIMFGTTAPDAPTASAASNITCTSANTNWTAVSGATAYYLDVSSSASFANMLPGYNNINTGNVTAYNITGLTVNYTYYYRVRSSNGCSISSNSNTSTFGTYGPAAPSANAATNVACTSLTANWTGSIGTSTYFIDVATDALFTNFVAGYNNLNVGNVLTYNITGLTVNTTYYYRVRASNSCTSSSNSNSISLNTVAPALISTLTPPAICSGTTFNYTPTSGTSGATFTWTRAAVAGISNAASSGSGNPIEVLNNTTASTINVTYVYTVTANGCTNSTLFSVVVPVNSIPTLSSTLTPPAIFSGTVFTYTPTSSSVGATFSWTRAAVTGISNASASGAGNPNETLTNTTAAPINVTYVYTVTANGCSNPTTYNVVVTVVPDVVWPGDANSDSLVNNVDLLPIGLYYSQTGAPRTTTGNTFQADLATNWGTLETNGQDIKHADCNGDGIIDMNDTLAINLNFNLTHAIVPVHNANYNETRTTPDMYFVISGSSFNAGDFVDAEVWLGTTTTPVTNLYGISFNINYNESLVQSGTESVSYPSSWIGTPGTSSIKIGKVDALANTAYGAVTRIDHNNASGFGKIADFKFQIKTSLTSPAAMPLSICCIVANNAAGLAQTITTQTDSVLINQATGIQENNNASSIVVSPNPFTSQTTVSFSKKIKNGTVKIRDVVGKEVRSIDFSGNQLIIEKGELNAGIYFVQVVSEKNVIANKKIIIQ